MTTSWDLRSGRWQDVLQHVEHVDSVITDPPYSAQTHDGQRTGSSTRKSTINYDPMTREEAHAFIAAWAPRVRSWVVVFGDDTTQGWFKEALRDAGLYTFAPLPFVKTDAPPRQSGDGPASGTEWIVVARTMRKPAMPGSRPPHYTGPTASTRGAADGMPGSKPLWLMRCLLSDYTQPGDLVCDPFAGMGTTGVACVERGRMFVGAEVDAERAAAAAARINAAACQQDLFGVEPPRKAKPQTLFAADEMRATRSRRPA